MDFSFINSINPVNQVSKFYKMFLLVLGLHLRIYDIPFGVVLRIPEFLRKGFSTLHSPLFVMSVAVTSNSARCASYGSMISTTESPFSRTPKPPAY